MRKVKTGAPDDPVCASSPARFPSVARATRFGLSPRVAVRTADGRTDGHSLLQSVVLLVTVGEAEAPAVIVDHHRDMVRPVAAGAYRAGLVVGRVAGRVVAGRVVGGGARSMSTAAVK